MSLNHSEVFPTKNKNSEDYLIQNLALHLSEKDNSSFKIPKLPEPFLSLNFTEETKVSKTHVNTSTVKLAASDVVTAYITSAKRLTSNDETVKKTLKLSIGFKDKCIAFEPGDSFGFLCPNPEEEVNALLKRLNVLDVSDKTCEITAKQNKKIPSHIPQVSTLKQMFTSYVDIRVVPKKALLRVIANYTKAENEILMLEFLSSQEGMVVYDSFVRKPSLSILDVLSSFKSCVIPVERLLEHLPPVKPRFYSVTSSPLVSSTSFDIAFNVIEINQSDGRCCSRKGICTGWLEGISKKSLKQMLISDETLDMSRLSLEDKHTVSLEYPCISIFKRQNKFFCLPKDLNVPLIMVGPGTGVAPFIGFLQQRKKQMETSGKEIVFGDTWLFYGCRHKEKDFLFRSELEEFHSSRILSHLVVCFSRDDQSAEQPRRVQENIVTYSAQLSSLIDSGGHVYICGDATNMSRDIQEAFIRVFQEAKNCSKEIAESLLKKLQEDKRYLVDVWT